MQSQEEVSRGGDRPAKVDGWGWEVARLRILLMENLELPYRDSQSGGAGDHNSESQMERPGH